MKQNVAPRPASGWAECNLISRDFFNEQNLAILQQLRWNSLAKMKTVGWSAFIELLT
ncbi:MAG: hypothetical protein GY856_41965 [bacterium]|nr:hypothetical protein [bacterium]